MLSIVLHDVLDFNYRIAFGDTNFIVGMVEDTWCQFGHVHITYKCHDPRFKSDISIRSVGQEAEQ